MNNNATTVYVIDDDDAVRESLSWLLESVGLKVETYADARSFLAHITTSQTNGCVVTDVRMPGMSGLELQTELTERQIGLPVIIITG
ncbi:MAG TPA: response regulator, partial [Gammaproteobacteria bacterium]|nr:response regulator [Gammaproteobacteria bacterium]